MDTESEPATQANKAARVSAPISDYGVLQAAFDHFNRDLFDGQLPRVLLTFKRGRRHKGKYTRSFFSAATFESRANEDTVDEISLNPFTFEASSDEDILSCLAHEMVHLWQAKIGNPSPRGYHNREWVEKMLKIGLHPTDTGLPGGGRTGPRVDHLIIADGPFQKSARLFLIDHTLGWQSPPKPAEYRREVRFTNPVPIPYPTLACPGCGQFVVVEGNKHRLKCGYCGKAMNESGREPEMVAWILKLIKTAQGCADHEFASRLFDDAQMIYRSAPEAVFYVCVGIIHGIDSTDGPGLELKRRAADSIFDFLKDRGDETFANMVGKLISFNAPFYGESVGSDQSGMINDLILKLETARNQHRRARR